MPSYMGAPETELAKVAEGLRARLGPDADNLAFDDAGARVLNQFLSRLSAIERALLSRKKQRALEEMELIVGKLVKFAAEQKRQSWVDHLQLIQGMLLDPRPERQPDWDKVASQWLDVIRPVWFEKLASKRNKPLLLKDIRKDLLARPIVLIEQLEKHFQRFPVLPSPEERIRACIIGVC